MTPTEQWILWLALIYAVPSFLGGAGLALLLVHWRALRRTAAVVGDNLDIYASHADELALKEQGNSDGYAALRNGWIKSLTG